MTPAGSKRLLQNNLIETLMDLLTDQNNTDSNLVYLYNGELEPMVVSRLDNMLEVLKATKDWRELHDQKRGRPCYHNLVTKETVWQNLQH